MKPLSEKQNRRLKQLHKKMWKFIALFLLADLLFAAIFLRGIQVNTPLAEQQLRTVSGTVESVSVHIVPKNLDFLIITIDGHQYTLTCWETAEQLDQYIQYLSSSKPYVSVTLVEHQPFPCLINGWRKIIAISDGETSVDYSEATDRDMMRQRRVCTVVGILLGVFGIPFEVLVTHVTCFGEYMELKHLQRKRHQKTGDGSLS